MASHMHEETRATFSHSAANTPTVVVTDMNETIELAKYINGEKPLHNFYEEFKGRFSEGFDVDKDLAKNRCSKSNDDAGK